MKTKEGVSRETVLNAGCDWLTATATPENAALDVFAREHIPMAKAKVWGDRFYRGYSYGDIAYGEGKQGSIIKLAGSAAREFWREPATYADNISRCDWQVTVIRDRPEIGYAGKLARIVVERREQSRAQYRVTHTVGYGAGDTLYIGSRSSEAFARVYDKGKRERTHTEGLIWRHELEMKGVKARSSICSALQLTDDGATYAESVVQRYLTHKGINPSWVSTISAPLPRGKYVKPAPPTTIRWLRDGVRPAIYKLSNDGYLEAVAEALDVDFLLLTALLQSHYEPVNDAQAT